MKDKELQLEEIEAALTLGGAKTPQASLSGKGACLAASKRLGYALGTLLQ